MGKLRPEYARHAFAGYQGMRDRPRPRLTGAVLSYQEGDGRGFGFVRPDDPDRENIYLAGRELRLAGVPWLEPGDRVEFEEGLDRFGRREAKRLRVLG